MKLILQKLLLIIGLVLPISTLAYDIEQDGIHYNFIDDTYEVAVVGSSKSEIIIPNRIFYDGKEYIVTKINQGAFYDRKDLISVEMGDSLREIMNESFRQCDGLEKVRFGKNLRVLGDLAFSDCHKIDSIWIPDSLQVIGKAAFSFCYNLKYAEMGKSVNLIYDNGFSYCNHLEKIIFKKPLVPFSDYIDLYFSAGSFSNCVSLKEVEIDDLTSWCRTSGNGSPANPTCYGANLYLNGELITKLVVPEDAGTVGSAAFAYAPSIISAELPSKIRVSDYAFNCSNIHSLTLKGGSETYIGYGAFTNAKNLMTIIADSETPAYIYDDNTFNSDTYYKGTLYVPVGAKQAYKEAKGWKNFANIKEGIPDPDLTTYVLSINAGYGGTVVYDSHNLNNSKETFYLREGSDATISILPYSGYIVDEFLLNGVNYADNIVDNQYTITSIDSDIVIDVSFIEKPVYITIRQTNSVPVKQKAVLNQRYDFYIEDTPGWKISQVLFNYYDVTNSIVNATYTTPQIKGDSELIITKEPADCALSCAASPGGRIIINDSQYVEGIYGASIPWGSHIIIGFEAFDGYSLGSLYVDGMNITNDILAWSSYAYGPISKDVSIQAFFEKKDKCQYNLEIQDAAYGISFLRIPEGNTLKYTVHNIDGWKLNTISFNGMDVTGEIVDSTYTTPEITGNSLLSVSFEKDDNGSVVNQIISPVRVSAYNMEIVVMNVNCGDNISVYNESGILITSKLADQEECRIPINNTGIYIVKVAGSVFKIIL